MLLWRMEFGGENGSFGSGLMPSAQDDRGNLGAFPVLHVILSERSESKNPLPFGEFERMRVLRRAACGPMWSSAPTGVGLYTHVSGDS